MNKLLRIIRRATSASPNEWLVRGKQAIFAAQNLAASSLGRSALPINGHLKSLGRGPEELQKWWSQRGEKWFIQPGWTEQMQRLASDPSSQIPWVLERADLVVAGKMPLFTYPDLDFQGDDRWHRDFILDKTSPRKFHGAVGYLNPDEVGDSKHVWEPNRFAWAIWLGVAYRVTGDAKYANKFAELTTDWFHQNPYPIGINYCSALEIGFRNYAWLWSLDLFSECLAEHPVLLEQILKGIWIGCRHVESNLSYYFAANTHIIGEGFSLFACGAALPEFADSARWRKLGQQILSSESQKQVHQDGMHKELSSVYHIYSTDFFQHAILIGRQTGFELPTTLEATTVRMAKRLAELAPHNHVLPQWNDNDGGRLMWLVPEVSDAAPTLFAAQLVSPELKLISDSIPRRGYSLLMAPQASIADVPSQCDSVEPSRAPASLNKELAELYDSGLVSYANPDGDYVLFRSTPFGYMDCPHSHDAPLGVIVHLGGQPVFVDNGTGSYTQGAERRNQFRLARGKNALLLDGNGPSLPADAFGWEKTVDCELVSVKRSTNGFQVCGGHSGYSVSPSGHVFVQREVLAIAEGVVAIVDRWDTDDKIPLHAEFTLHPSVKLDRTQQLLSTNNDSVTVHFHASSLDGKAVELVENRICYSSNYGHVGETSSLAMYPDVVGCGGMVLIMSRIGMIERTPNNEFVFKDNTCVRLALTDRGVQPLRRDSMTPESALFS